MNVATTETDAETETTASGDDDADDKVLEVHYQPIIDLRSGVVDGAEDSDGDRLANHAEQRFGLNPARKDTDGSEININA